MRVDASALFALRFRCARESPKFVFVSHRSKAYSRLGLACFNLNDIPGALAAYKKGLELEPTNETLKAGLAEVQHSGASSACCCVACDANATQSRFPCDSRVCAYACMHACKRMCDDDDGDDGARTANEIKSLGVAMKVMWTAMDWWAALEGNPSESNCVVVCLRILFRFAR